MKYKHKVSSLTFVSIIKSFNSVFILAQQKIITKCFQNTTFEFKYK